MKKILLVTGLGLACIAPAQITKVGNAYQLRAKYTAGSVVKYSVLATLGGLNSKQSGKPMQFTVPMSWKVVSVSKGVATVDTSVGPISMAGSTQSIMQATKNRIQVDSKGKVIGQAGAGQQLTPALPEKPVRIGQTWTVTAPIEVPMQGTANVKATYTFKGIKTVNGKQMADLAVVTSGKANGKGSMLLLMSDGSLFKSNMEMTLKMAGPDGNPTDYKVTAAITRK